MASPYGTISSNKHRKKRPSNPYTGLLVILTVLLVLGIGTLIFFLLKDQVPKTPDETLPVVSIDEPGSSGEEQTKAPVSAYEALLKTASVTAAMYDYDGAIEMVTKEVPGYEEVPELAAFVQECKANRSKLVKWADNSQITHVFYHTLVADAELAFSGYKRKDYNEVMTTIEEFLKITQSMYEKGYVLVHIEDIAKIVEQPDGTKQMQYQPIYLPAGKIPFVLSVDDVSYYEYMNNTGFASRLVIDEDGRIVNEMDIYEEVPGTSSTEYEPQLVRDANGAPVVKSTVRGDFDVVPLLDRFVEEHPDFSYHGAKGTIALTGYNGVLGYRTSEISYGSKDPAKVDLTIYEKWPKTYEYYNVNIEEDRIKAKEVADAMKAEGWKFASHTWGHMRMEAVVDKSTGTITAERFTRDTTWWENEVRPIIGDTDIIIFAFGSDIGSWRGYSNENEAFMYLKNLGFNYFCNVDGSVPAWVQISKTAGGTGYLRMGRRNLDGMLMFKQLVNPDKHILDDLFDVKEVFDRRRPIPVTGVSIPEGTDMNHLFD